MAKKTNVVAALTAIGAPRGVLEFRLFEVDHAACEGHVDLTGLSIHRDVCGLCNGYDEARRRWLAQPPFNDRRTVRSAKARHPDVALGHRDAP